MKKCIDCFYFKKDEDCPTFGYCQKKPLPEILDTPIVSDLFDEMECFEEKTEL
jgi:hypothetical protein